MITNNVLGTSNLTRVDCYKCLLGLGIYFDQTYFLLVQVPMNFAVTFSPIKDFFLGEKSEKGVNNAVAYLS